MWTPVESPDRPHWMLSLVGPMCLCLGRKPSARVDTLGSSWQFKFMTGKERGSSQIPSFGCYVWNMAAENNSRTE